MLLLLCYLLFNLCGLFSLICQAQSVPNLYVFGDSIFDSGCKSAHAAGLKTGYRPYGIECAWLSPCRFTNGKTIPEIIAKSLKMRPPVTIDETDVNPECGVNYASASAGILLDTGSAFGNKYCMDEQVNFFRNTVENPLRAKFPSAHELSEYLSDSLFLINIGSSDYIHNYLRPDSYNTSHQYSGQDFAELLTSKLENHLKDLYNLGARKMIVFEIGPLGCLPYIINRAKASARCVDDVNRLVSVFNNKLSVKLKELGEKLDGSVFVTARTFDLMKSMIQNPSDYGFEETRWPCCVTQENGTGLCKGDPTYQPDLPGESHQRLMQNYYVCMDLPPLKLNQSQIGKPVEYLCPERQAYLFFDQLHLTEAAYKFLVTRCLNSTSDGICSPFGINHLAKI